MFTKIKIPAMFPKKYRYQLCLQKIEIPDKFPENRDTSYVPRK